MLLVAEILEDVMLIIMHLFLIYCNANLILYPKT